jgi:hypothetical protein
MSLALDENLRRALAGARRALEERIALAQSMRIQAIEKGQMSRSHSLRHVDELAAAFATGNWKTAGLRPLPRCSPRHKGQQISVLVAGEFATHSNRRFCRARSRARHAA